MLRHSMVAVVLLLVWGSADAMARTWKSASGALQMEAELVEKKTDGTVVLKRADGANIVLKVEKFSAADQEYVRQWTPGSKPKEVPIAKVNGAAKGTATPGTPPPAASPTQAPQSSLTPEMKAARDKIKLAEAKAAFQEYDDAQNKVGAVHAAKHKEYREKLISLFEEAFKDATEAGNLDDALAIRNAIKELRNEGNAKPGAAVPDAPKGVKSAKATDAFRKYRAASKRLDEGHEKQRKENRSSLVAKLEQSVKVATKDNQLEDALAIRDAVKVLRNAEAPAAPSGSPEAKGGKVANPEPRKGGRGTKGRIFACCDDGFIMCVNGKEILRANDGRQASVLEYAFSKGDVITVRVDDPNHDGEYGFCCVIALEKTNPFMTSRQWAGYVPKDVAKWQSANKAAEIYPIRPGSTSVSGGRVQNACGINAMEIWGKYVPSYLVFVIP